MIAPTSVAIYVLVWCAAQAFPVAAQEPILPHGDPRLRSSEEEAARQDEIRDHRLKQQGQGSNYRIEGEPQPSAGTEPSSAGSKGVTGQDTPISDPSVNPGQAAGMKTIHGRIVDTKSDQLIVQLQNGGETTLLVDHDTVGDTDLRPGDVITGIVTPQGRAVTLQKKEK